MEICICDDVLSELSQNINECCEAVYIYSRYLKDMEDGFRTSMTFQYVTLDSHRKVLPWDTRRRKLFH